MFVTAVIKFVNKMENANGISAHAIIR